MLKLLLCSCTWFVTDHCTTVLYISQYCTIAHRDILHITATCGHVNVNIACHYIVVLHKSVLPLAHTDVHLYLYFYIYSLLLLLQHSSTFIFIYVYVYFVHVCFIIFYLCVCLFLFLHNLNLSWHSVWTAKKEFHCTGKLAFPHCAHDNKCFES